MLTLVATIKTTIGDTDNHLLTHLVNSAATALLIGLPLKGAMFCHTSNTLLVGRQHHPALLLLYFKTSAVSWLLVVGRSVHLENRYAMTFEGDCGFKDGVENMILSARAESVILSAGGAESTC
jgi:hypothetical protein